MPEEKVNRRLPKGNLSLGIRASVGVEVEVSGKRPDYWSWERGNPSKPVKSNDHQ